MADEDKNEKRSDAEKLARAQEALAKNAKDRDAIEKAKADTDAELARTKAELEALKAQKIPKIGSRCIAKHPIHDVVFRDVKLSDGSIEKERIPVLICDRGDELPFDPKKPSGKKTFHGKTSDERGNEITVPLEVDFSRGYSGLVQGQHYEYR